MLTIAKVTQISRKTIKTPGDKGALRNAVPGGVVGPGHLQTLQNPEGH